MFQLRACRMCLASNVRLHSIANTELQEIYEKLTNITADGKPLTVCYLCYSQLRTSRHLMLKALKAEELFSNVGVPISPLDRQTHKLSSSLSITPIENQCTVPPLFNAIVKDEAPDFCEPEPRVKTELIFEDVEDPLAEVKLECEYNGSPSKPASEGVSLNSNNVEETLAEVKLECEYNGSPSEPGPKGDALNSNSTYIPNPRLTVSRTYSRKRHNDGKIK